MAYGNYAPFYRGGFFNPMQAPPMPNVGDNQNAFIQQTYPQQQIQPPVSIQTQPVNDMIWVLNENEATSYPVAPNNSVVLWDKSNPTIYVKSVNAQGMPSMRVLDFVERTMSTSNYNENTPKTHECKCGDKFATKEQIEVLKQKIDELATKYEELAPPIVEKTKMTTKKTKESEE